MAKCTDKELVVHFEKLYKEKAKYVWGADCQVCSYDVMKQLLKIFKSKTYDEQYYLVDKYNESKGHIIADCSGAFTSMSGKNQIARAYYNETKEKARIAEMPKYKVCLVWNKNLTHIGLYCGNGYTIEMKSSKDNCVKQKFNKSRWYYYGCPDWVEYTVDDWVARLQNVIGAKVDNIVGKETLSKTPTIKKGVKGEVVKLVQERLEYKYNISVGKCGCDGSCGKDTVEAIKIFQKKYVGLKNPDGEITSGHITWKTLLGL